MTTLTIDLLASALRCDDVSTWDEQRLQRAIQNYTRFLLLVADDPSRPIAPTKDIDAIWHLHMLSPVAYHRDCMALFGELLDHDGGFGKEPDEEVVLSRVFEETSARWLEKFGEPYVAGCDRATKCWHDCKGRCWHACKSVGQQVACA